MKKPDDPRLSRTPPPSATSAWTALAGVTAFIASVAILYKSNPFSQIAHSALFVLLFTAAAIFAVDIPWRKVYRRESSGLDFSKDNLSWSRSACKFAGLLGSFAFVGLLYWVFPEYHGSFYDNYYRMLKIVLPVWILASIPYILLIDRIMRAPLDGYWHMGKAVTLQWSQVDFPVLRQHLAGWLIRGFFLPLMFTYFCNDIPKMLAFEFGFLSNFHMCCAFLSDFFYFIDVGLVSMGYLISLRITDTHLRSAHPTMLGWAVALVCYEPFWSLIGRQYLHYDHYGWERWLSGSPFLYDIWDGVILALVAIYAWATVAFGARFSNLTHRGIITSGPYRYTKHPAYIAKNLSWWLISVPFIAPHGDIGESVRCCLALLMLNGIYWLRAKTEEFHLSRDPEYVKYVLWMKEHGIFRFLCR